MGYDRMVYGLCHMFYLWRLCGFCEKYLDGLRVKKIFAMLFLCVEVHVNFFLLPGDIPYIFRSVLSRLLFLGFTLAVARDTFEKKLFVSSLLVAVQVFVLNFGCSFFSCMALLAAHTFTRGQAVWLGMEADYLIGGAAYCLAVFVLHLLGKRIGCVIGHKTKSWYVMLSVPSLLMAFLVEMVNWGASNGIMLVPNAGSTLHGNIYYDQLFSHTGICVLTALSMCLVLGAILGMHRIDTEQRQKAKYHAQVEFYQMQSGQYRQMERLRHDMKNHVRALYGLWENREFERLGAYLGQMLERGEIGTADEVTGNGAVDALLLNQRRLAQQHGIRWECEVRMPKACGIDVFDLCVLFGNMLDNAHSGCMEVEDGEDRFIRIQARPVKRCFLLVVQNGTVLQSSREIREGMGMLNMRETVKKYGGTMQAKVREQVFELSVLLPAEGDGHDGNKTTESRKLNRCGPADEISYS